MRPPGPWRRRVLDQLLDVVLDRAPAGRARVAVDGVDGSGKTVLADELADLLGARGRAVVRASEDDFHRTRVERYRLGRTSAEGFYRDSYDLPVLRRDLLEPWAPGGSGRYRRRAHDLVTDERLEPRWEQAPDDALLLVDGLFLQRPELAGTFEVTVFVDVPFEVTFARMAERDGCDPDPEHPANARYVGAQRHYLAAHDPRGRADVLLDNADAQRPVLRRPSAVG
ncbi:hypothetical protein GCM10027446_34400 [Angustibacter peucedani]